MVMEHILLINKIFSFERNSQTLVEFNTIVENEIDKFCREHKVMFSTMETVTDKDGIITGYSFFLRYKP